MSISITSSVGDTTLIFNPSKPLAFLKNLSSHVLSVLILTEQLSLSFVQELNFSRLYENDQ